MIKMVLLHILDLISNRCKIFIFRIKGHVFLHRESLDTEFLNQDDEPKQKRVRTEDVSGMDHSISDVNDDDDSDDGGGVPYEELRPTYTHEALCKLVQLGLLKHIISQNGDGLHGLSGIPLTNLSELHGNVFIEKCEKCGTRYERPFYVLDDHASLYYEELNDFGATTVKKPRHAKQCDLCGLCHRTGRKCTRKVCMHTVHHFQVAFCFSVKTSLCQSHSYENNVTPMG